ncbi:cyclin-dependent protein kinase inhibitor SMR13-like [Capsicum galapagoense]
MAKDLQFPKDSLENQSPNMINSPQNECKTPKSPSFCIPKNLKCPGAPKKPKRVVSSSCKRRLRFVEIIAEEEVESFFRIIEAVVDDECNRKIKRSRCM